MDILVRKSNAGANGEPDSRRSGTDGTRLLPKNVKSAFFMTYSVSLKLLQAAV